MDLVDVEREALRDWLRNRPDPEPPDPDEYRDLEQGTGVWPLQRLNRNPGSCGSERSRTAAEERR